MTRHRARVRRMMLAATLLLAPGPLGGQRADANTLVALARHLDVTLRAVVISARPEDEPAGLVAWLHHGLGADVGVVSLHRGEAGGNRFGREISEALGVLRAAEMPGVRAVAGGRQFFTRAYDFGLLGPREDLWEHWPRPLLVEDVATILRSVRPHLVVLPCETPEGLPDPQRQAVQIVAQAAWEAAADTAQLPVRDSGYLPPWQTPHLYRIACPGRLTGILVDLGRRDPVLGESYLEIGARAMARQQSQGLGTRITPGPAPVYLERIATRVPAEHLGEGLLAGALTSWGRLAGDQLPASRASIDSLGDRLKAVAEQFDARRPDRSAGSLLALLSRLQRLRNELLPIASPQAPWRAEDADLHAGLLAIGSRVTALVVAALGLDIRLEAPASAVAPPDSFPATLTVANRGNQPVTVLGGLFTFGLHYLLPGRGDSLSVAPDSAASWTVPVHPLDVSVPYWLRGERPGDFYRYPPGLTALPALRLGEADATPGRGELRLRVAGVEFPVPIGPLRAVRLDPGRGEVAEPVMVMPAITVLLERVLDYVPAGQLLTHRVVVEVRNWTTGAREVEVQVEAPPGSRVTPASHGLALAGGARAEVVFQVSGRLPRGRHTLRVRAVSEGQTFAAGAIPIRYDHIDPAVYYRGSGLWLDAAPVRVPATAEIGYLPGDQDFTHVALRQLEVPATELTPAGLDSAGLARYRRIAIGPRALRDPRVARAIPELLAWMRRGGRLVLLWQGEELAAAGLLPWPVAWPDRPRHQHEPPAAFVPGAGAATWLTTPHRLDADDFDEWVRSVALFQPDSLDARYRPILGLDDGGGGPPLPVAWSAPVGRGTLVYTTLSLPRQVLAGEAGALRLLLNFLLAPASGTPPASPPAAPNSPSGSSPRSGH